MSEEITLKDLLDTEFTINEYGKMVGTFSLDRINMISDILIDLQDTLQDREDYIGHLEELCNKYEEEREKVNKILDITMQIIREQPTVNDEWILTRLYGIKEVMNK